MGSLKSCVLEIGFLSFISLQRRKRNFQSVIKRIPHLFLVNLSLCDLRLLIFFDNNSRGLWTRLRSSTKIKMDP